MSDPNTVVDEDPDCPFRGMGYEPCRIHQFDVDSNIHDDPLVCHVAGEHFDYIPPLVDYAEYIVARHRALRELTEAWRDEHDRLRSDAAKTWSGDESRGFRECADELAGVIDCDD